MKLVMTKNLKISKDKNSKIIEFNTKMINKYRNPILKYFVKISI